MRNSLLDDKIQDFWEWFVANESIIIEAINSEGDRDHSALVNQLDNQVLQFGAFAWEIGFGKSKPYFLTISPNNSKELLAISKKVMHAAPSLESWEFNPAKLAIDWDLNFKVYDSEFDAHKIDASNWQQVLRKNINGTIDIVLLAQSIFHLDTDTQKRACDMVVTSLLGEAIRINMIGEIEIVDQFETQKDKIRSGPIQILLKQVEGYQKV